MSQTIFITGANRGLGLEFVKQYLEDGFRVIATCRAPQKADGLNALRTSNLTTHALDVSDFAAVKNLQQELAGEPIDILLNNAGIYGSRDQVMGSVDPLDMQQVILVNSIAPVMMAQTFLSNLQQGEAKVLANVTSRMGSIADNTSGRSYAYRASKAALNAMMHSIGIDLSREGIKVLLLHPGWVKTDMGGDSATVLPKESIQGMRTLISKAHDLKDEFYHYQGHTLPW